MARNPKIWEYLIESPYTLRHLIAEYFLSESKNVIDVGTYKRKLNVNGNLFCIDPLMTLDDAFHGDVEMFIEDNEIPEDFDLCCIGCDIEGGEDQWNAFLKLFTKSKIAVIEYPVNMELSHSRISNDLTKIKNIFVDIYLDLPSIEVDSLIPPNTKRRFLVFK